MIYDLYIKRKDTCLSQMSALMGINHSKQL